MAQTAVVEWVEASQKLGQVVVAALSVAMAGGSFAKVLAQIEAAAAAGMVSLVSNYPLLPPLSLLLGGLEVVLSVGDNELGG